MLAQVQEAVKVASSLYSSGVNLGRSASSVGEHQTPGFESPGLRVAIEAAATGH